MTHHHHLLAKKDLTSNLMWVTMNSHCLPPFFFLVVFFSFFPSKIINSKQMGLLLLYLVDVIYQRGPGKANNHHLYPLCFLAHPARGAWGNQQQQPPESWADFLWGAAVCQRQQWRHVELSVPCQLHPVSRSSLTRVSPREAPGNQLHVKLPWRESFICWRVESIQRQG